MRRRLGRVTRGMVSHSAADLEGEVYKHSQFTLYLVQVSIVFVSVRFSWFFELFEFLLPFMEINPLIVFDVARHFAMQVYFAIDSNMKSLHPICIHQRVRKLIISSPNEIVSDHK